MEPPRLSKLQELFQELNKQSALCLYSLAEHHALMTEKWKGGSFPWLRRRESWDFL